MTATDLIAAIPAPRNPYISPKWPGKLFRKINIFADRKYVASSNAYRTCGDAIMGWRATHALKPGERPYITAYFDK